MSADSAEKSTEISPELRAFGEMAEAKQPRTLADLRALLEQAERQATEHVHSDEDLEVVRVYNRARKQFRHDNYLAQPSSFVELPRWLAVKWMAMFPEDIISGEDALKSVDASAVAAAELSKKNEALEADKAALSAELEAMRKQLAERSPAG